MLVTFARLSSRPAFRYDFPLNTPPAADAGTVQLNAAASEYYFWLIAFFYHQSTLTGGASAYL